MVRAKEGKTTSLILTVVIILVYFVIPVDSGIGLSPDGSLSGRLLYPFLHANFFHALLNCWCLLSFMFLYDLSVWVLFAAYAIAVSVPGCLVQGLTVGMSGVCLSLMGFASSMVKRKLYYTCFAIAFLGMGFVFQNCATWLHIYCYILGALIGLINLKVNE